MISIVDKRLIKMIYAMFEADQQIDLWDELSENIKADGDEAFLRFF